MKWIVVAVIALCSFSAKGQNMGDAFEFIKNSYKTIPVHSNQPFYDTAIRVERPDLPRLTESMQHFFESNFESFIVDTEHHAFVGFGTYNFRTTKKESIENSYVVNYSVRVTITDRGYKLAMENFTIINQEREISFIESYKSAVKNNGICNQFLAYFNWHNQKELRKMGSTITSIVMPSTLTASR